MRGSILVSIKRTDAAIILFKLHQREGGDYDGLGGIEGWTTYDEVVGH